jgi:hypothetical protein
MATWVMESAQSRRVCNTPAREDSLTIEPNQSKRTWNTPARERWNAPIHHMLKAIDNHVDLFLKTGDGWHMAKAESLRLYLHELKQYIHKSEGR